MQEITERLRAEGAAVSMITGQVDDAERDRVIDEFKSGRTKALVTSDLLARGTDVLAVQLVFNYDMPFTRVQQRGELVVKAVRVAPRKGDGPRGGSNSPCARIRRRMAASHSAPPPPPPRACVLRRQNKELYLNRVGRTGRFGKLGVAVTLINSGQAYELMAEVEKHFGRQVESENMADVTLETLDERILAVIERVEDWMQQRVPADVPTAKAGTGAE